MGKPRLGVRLDAKSHGEIHSKWNEHFRKEFQEDRTACFTEFYFAGKNYVKSMADGREVFSNMRGAFLSGKYITLSDSTIRIRLDDNEQGHVFMSSRTNRPISSRNKKTLCATVAAYIVIGYREVKYSVINCHRTGEEL